MRRAGAFVAVVLCGALWLAIAPLAHADLVSYYDFDTDVAAGGTVAGALGTPYSGTLVNDAVVSGGVLNLLGNNDAVTGSGDYMALPDIRAGSFAGKEATLSLWLKRVEPSQSGSRCGLVALGTGLASHYGWGVDQGYFSMFQTGRPSVALRSEVDRTTWHHLAITTEPGTGTYKIYQAGVEAPGSGASPGTFVINPSPWIGRSNRDAGTGSDYFFYGEMDEVAIFDHALTAAEVAGLADRSLTVRDVAGNTIRPGGAGAIGTETRDYTVSNIALAGTANQSSRYSATIWGPEVAIDGLKHPATGDFSHTANGQPEQWWEVNLGAPCEVDEVRIYNRSASFVENLLGTSAGGGFRASILDENGAVVGYSDHDWTDTFAYPFVIDQFLVGGTPEDVVVGQTVRLEKLLPLETGNSGWHATWNLSEVEVDGTCPSLSMGEYDSLETELDGNAGTSDLVDVSGTLTLAGWLKVSMIGGALVTGDSFDILNWGELLGTFDEVFLPDLRGSMEWDTSMLYVDGTITVVPEPATCVLLAIGSLGVLRRRRRK